MDELEQNICRAVYAVKEGNLVVLPTDTVYGVGADPFSVAAVSKLLTAKGRGRDKPSPVLVYSLEQARSLASSLTEEAVKMAEDLWPGALTLVVPAQETIGWDLGETHGTVALRMPNHPTALELLNRTGPMAVTSANLTGNPPARTAQDAREQLGEKVAVYIDAGLAPGGVPSTIVSFPAPGECHIIRQGAIRAEIIAKYGKIV
ncbi:L-threonylcarbamoyladenylate synthase [Actinotignum urinale]|uniref:L-threonylcarbamoyladenylate synthase n=1 Tax=Actinotignum urinale TaxID=190146 RepID=UPI0003B3FCB3|nr:L-threonylcarbamoyladenylate synthase [Actinotignum urinale]MDY5129435.1 L-threonylcarbamoyladenylate synthase [Actinotignum urinale]MDY5161043.1 L-threonylcarbamoyladenylate synthase [Actinotignum urinale]WIK59393.1 L-threonylcarbamoyladenylate synthase [Actinotignum urinale]